MDRLFVSRFDAPFAILHLEHDGHTLHRLDFRAADSVAETTARTPDWLAAPLLAYFDGEIDALDRIPVTLAGTEFQRRVWDGLRRIPAGEAWSYARLAREIGNDQACRAVGSANGRNPVALVVPCHRVIAADGTIGGYSSGMDNKRWLLRHEGVTPRER